MINTAEQHQISGLGSITMPDAFILWRSVKVSGIVLFLKLMTLSFFKPFQDRKMMIFRTKNGIIKSETIKEESTHAD